MVVGVICSPELIYRRMVVDTTDETNWCVFTLNADQPNISGLYSASSICLFLIPFNLVCSIMIIIVIGQMIQKTVVKVDSIGQASSINLSLTPMNTNFMSKLAENGIIVQIAKHKHLLVAPILLAIFAVPRLVFAFVFVCSKLDRFPFLTLPSYLIGFLPSMSLFFALISPSKVYRDACLTFIKLFIHGCVRN
ncbi:unnamed protein product [Adineta ricciae]|uniref:Uncharacterized protein n=1 Tax=Adineta ricciae TaxID=249248 RepID=A0A815PUY4_ADIRI|nr:unnamed protein product [Adineta ricciae]